MTTASPVPSTVDGCFRLEGQIVVVTGGGHGIGRQIATDAASLGAKVVVADIDTAGAESAVAELRETGRDGLALGVDVSQGDSVEAMFEEVARHYGRITGLVNNAAIYASRRVRRAPFEDILETEWDAMMDVNLKGVWLCCRAASRLMTDATGSIVNIGSGTSFKGTEEMSHYVSAKGAVAALTRTLAKELGARNIRVNTVVPGAIRSEAVTETGDGDLVGRALARPGVPEDISRVVAFFLAEASAFITGQALVVDGGSYLH